MSEFKIGGLAGEEAGEGVPVVLLHGLTATRRYVVMGSKNLERGGHRVVMYDARGHGRSEPGDGYGYERLARTCWPCSTTAASTARCWPEPRWEGTRWSGSRWSIRSAPRRWW